MCGGETRSDLPAGEAGDEKSSDDDLGTERPVVRLNLFQRLGFAGRVDESVALGSDEQFVFALLVACRLAGSAGSCLVVLGVGFHGLFFIRLGVSSIAFAERRPPGGAASGSSLQRAPRPAPLLKCGRKRAMDGATEEKDLKTNGHDNGQEGDHWRAGEVGQLWSGSKLAHPDSMGRL